MNTYIFEIHFPKNLISVYYCAKIWIVLHTVLMIFRWKICYQNKIFIPQRIRCVCYICCLLRSHSCKSTWIKFSIDSNQTKVKKLDIIIINQLLHKWILFRYENKDHEDFVRDVLWTTTKNGFNCRFYSCGWDHKVISHKFWVLPS